MTEPHPPRIHVLHENDDWIAPMRQALDQAGLPHAFHHLQQAVLDPGTDPARGVWFSRMSASCHDRGHDGAPALAAAWFDWLEGAGRRVVNGRRALDLEMSKIRQHLALEAAGLRVPAARAAADTAGLVVAARELSAAGGDGPVIVKPNRGGRGSGVTRFDNPAELESALADGGLPPSADGVWLVQGYIDSPDPVVTRAEFIGGRFLYALEVTTGGAFTLCPAEVCEIPPGGSGPAFRIGPNPPQAWIAACERFLAANGIEVAGVEFMRDRDGVAWTYDVNTNTNYNPEAEAEAGLSGPATLAAFLGALLEQDRSRQD